MPRTSPWQQRARSPLATLAAITLTLGAGLIPASTAAASPATDPASSAVDVHVPGTSPQRLKSFWTPARLREAAANPAPAPDIEPGDARALARARATEAVPRTASAEGTLPLDVTAPRSSNFAAAAFSYSSPVTNVAAWPTRAVGYLYFTDLAGAPYHCTATSIASDTRNAVWTAGHCLHEGGGGDWYTNHIFIPAYANNSDPYGWWFGVSLVVTNGWSSGYDLAGSDVGAMIVVPETGNRNLADVVGAWGYRFDGATNISNVFSYGYPGSGYNRPDIPAWGGQYMYHCNGNTVDAANLNPLDNRLRMDCDMGGGASGGPMAIDMTASTAPKIVGTNSHRHVNDNGDYIDIYLFSSHHYTAATNVINAIDSGS